MRLWVFHLHPGALGSILSRALHLGSILSQAHPAMQTFLASDGSIRHKLNTLYWSFGGIVYDLVYYICPIDFILYIQLGFPSGLVGGEYTEELLKLHNTLILTVPLPVLI